MKKELIWVVDDDDDQRTILDSFFKEKKRYQVQLYANGKEALDAFKEAKRKPSLILLDIMMPEMDGITCLKNVRKLTKNNFIPILMLTAKIGSGDKVEALKAGADDFITKPFNINELEARVEVMLRIKRSEDQLKKYAKKLKKVNHLKQEMLSICSHDIQSPLSSVRMALDYLLDDKVEVSKNKQREYLDKIRRGVDKTLLLTRDILDLSKLEHTTLPFKKDYFSIDSLIQTSVESIEPLAQKRGISIQVKNSLNGALVYGDKRWMEQVICNLLSNAIKFNKEGGWVQIETKTFWGKRRTDNGSLMQVIVQDSGRGIAQDDIPKLFDKYVQLKKRDQLRGSGLGLAICHKVITHHHGNIWVKSKLGKGSSFFVTLPVKNG